MKKRIGFSSYPDFSGNSKALYEDMKNLSNDYDFIWFCRDENIANRLNERGINAIWNKSENFEEEFNKTEIVLNTHDDYMNLKKENQILINLWHGLGPKKMGTFIDSEVNWILKISSKFDYLVATSEFGKMLFSSAFSMPIERVKQFPQARYKWLYENKGKENLEKVLKKDLKQYKKIVMYAPTFKKGIGKEESKINKENVLNLNQYDEEILTSYLEKNDILLVLKLHPVEENILKEVESNNIVILKDNEMLDEFVTINEILDGVDLLISDYSSIYIDYINLERPVMFFDTDKDEYEKNRGILFETLDFWWMAGPQVHSIDKFIQETERLLNDSDYYKKEREKFNKIVNGKQEKSNKELIDFILNARKTDIDKPDYKLPLLEKSNAMFKNENEKIKSENEILKNENENIKNENERLINNNEELLSSNRELADGNKWIMGEYENLRQEYEKIIYSRSYKYTQKIKKLIKRG